jgi:para-nitrobenzyl esterase
MTLFTISRQLQLGLVLAAVLAADAQSQPTARTANGMVRGEVLGTGITLFKGIPFAAPPIGERRWKPPQPAANWQGVRSATRFGPQCMQARIYSDMVFRNEGTSEDCLYLNVWTPKASAGARLPVLVYIFGGGFMAGDGSEPRYDGENLARRGLVVVTLSHRLGIFGFFSHPALAAESPQHASGNYGLMDQVAALRWVKANIAAFGGDPARVTSRGRVSRIVLGVGAHGVSDGKGSFCARDWREWRDVRNDTAHTVASNDRTGRRDFRQRDWRADARQVALTLSA